MWIESKLEAFICSHSLELRKRHERGRGLLHICHSCFCATSNSWSWCISDTHLALGMLLLLLSCLIQLQFGCFCLILLYLCPICLWSLGGLIFLKEKTEGVCSRGSRNVVVRDGRDGVGGNFGWDVFYERGIYYKEINKFQI